MNEKALVLGKAPFNYGLFSSAVIGLLGEAARESCDFGGGHHDWCWEIKGRPKRKEMGAHFQEIQDWMKCFDLLWPGSRCDIARWEHSPDPEKLYLRITVRHKVEKSEE